MVKRHLSRLNAPKTWPIKRKGIKFITKPNPGSHSLATSMPISLVLKEMLKLVKTSAEAKKVLNSRKLKVNGKVKTDLKYSVGLMDVIQIGVLKENYRVLMNPKGKIIFHKISDAEAILKPSKIVDKTILKNKVVQINLSDGTNLLVKKDTYKVGDTVVIDLVKDKVKDHLKFEKGMLVYLESGKKVSSLGTIDSVKVFKGKQPDIIVFKGEDGHLLETKKEYAFVIGKQKPVISLPEK